MTDFYESIVRHINTPKERLLNLAFAFGGILGAAVVFLVFDIMGVHYFGIVAALCTLYFAIQAMINNQWEYEYIVTSGTVDIDQIIARRKRKRILSFDCRDCEIIAPLNKGNYYAEYKHLPVKDYTAFTAHEDNFFAVTERSGARVAIIFQPTEDMVQLFKSYNPRNVYIS